MAEIMLNLTSDIQNIIFGYINGIELRNISKDTSVILPQTIHNIAFHDTLELLREGTSNQYCSYHSTIDYSESEKIEVFKSYYLAEQRYCLTGSWRLDQCRCKCGHCYIDYSNRDGLLCYHCYMYYSKYLQ